MSKKLEKLDRLVNKLRTRYGASDPDVIRLNEELGALKAFEKFDRSGADMHWRATDFQTPGRKIQNSKLAERPLSSH